MLMISDMVRIAAAGGGLRIDCKGKLVSDLVRVAAASTKGARIVLENTTHILVSDKIRIAAAGQGSVFFNDIV